MITIGKTRQQAAQQLAPQVSPMPIPPLRLIEKYENLATAPPPPNPPFTGTYSVFGKSFPADNSVQDPRYVGTNKIPPTTNADRKKELHKLNQSILTNFLDLLDILIHNPYSPKREEKLRNINIMFVHMHDIINEFRLPQARETLRNMLEMQWKKRARMTENFQINMDLAQEIIENALSKLPEVEESLANKEEVESHDCPGDRLSEEQVESHDCPDDKLSEEQVESHDCPGDKLSEEQVESHDCPDDKLSEEQVESHDCSGDKLSEAGSIDPLDLFLTKKVDDADMSQEQNQSLLSKIKKSRGINFTFNDIENEEFASSNNR